jgi:1-acylglycerone phosphate reductase
VRKIFDINAFGVLSTTQHFAPLLIQAKGTIINVGSMTGRIQGPYASPYSASKAALEIMSHATRQEMEPFGMHTTHVCSPEPTFLHIANIFRAARSSWVS